MSGPNGFATTKKGHISGIITDDAARTIEIQLDHPEGDILYILALEFAHFVPAGTPASDQSTHPIPSTGPYMLQNYVPNRSFTLVRNPNYNNQIPTMPSGAPDKVVGKIITDPVASYQSVVSGQSDYDYNQVPNDRLPEAQSKYKDQLRIYTNANTWYYFLNNKIPPFNNIKARQAVNYAHRPSGDRLGPVRRSRAADGELPAAGLPAVQEDHRLHVRPRQGEAARSAVRDGGRRPSTSTARMRSRPRGRSNTSRVS